VRKLGTAQKKSLETAVAKYEPNLHLANDYLSGRGLDAEALRRFRLGVVTDPAPGHEDYVGRLCIPYLTTSGVVDVKFRCMRHTDCKAMGCVKYLAPDMAAVKGQGRPKSWLFNAQAVLEDADPIVLLEGEIDALSVETIANMPAVGQPGGTLWRKCPHWPRVFDGHEVVVVADGDKAGLQTAEDVASTLVDARIVRMPAGEDSNSFLRAHGADAYYERLGL
jgi:DNA primase